MNKINIPLIVILAVFHGVLLFNALMHNPSVGYDVPAHFDYIEALSEFRLPTARDTYEFFMPPLSYAPPALLIAAGFPSFAALKITQLLNVLYSFILCVFLLKLCEKIRPGDKVFKALSAGLLAMLPVYYKTFAFIRAEPMLAMAAVVAVYSAFKCFERMTDIKGFIYLGLILGAAVLIKQWAFFFLPPIIIFGLISAFKKNTVKSFIKNIGITLLISFITGGWFYIYLKTTYKTFVPFNTPVEERISLSNRPPEFYFGTGLKDLFKKPVTNIFGEKFMPIIYSETWGDYHGFWKVISRKPYNFKDILSDEQTHKENILTLRDTASYLGRVNAVSILPSVILLSGFILGIISIKKFISANNILYPFFGLILLFTAAGYFLFLIKYRGPEGKDVIKATYILYIFPFVSIIAADILLEIKKKFKSIFIILAVALALIFLHNIPVIITQCPFLTGY